MIETYNARERSFIKKPENKCCVTCGQPLTPEVKPMNNHMSQYINKISGRVLVLNSNEDTFTIDGVTLYKVGTPAASNVQEVKPVTPTVEVKSTVSSATTKPLTK
jgi:hypothetical protein